MPWGIPNFETGTYHGSRPSVGGAEAHESLPVLRFAANGSPAESSSQESQLW